MAESWYRAMVWNFRTKTYQEEKVARKTKITPLPQADNPFRRQKNLLHVKEREARSFPQR